MGERSAFDSLRALAGRLSDNPRYMAHALVTYLRQEGLSEEELAEVLGTPPELLVRLAMCLRPDADSPRFAEQLGELSDFTLADEGQLAHILRQVDSLEKLASVPAAPEVEARTGAPPAFNLTGLLAAARDREDEGEEVTDEDQAEENLDGED